MLVRGGTNAYCVLLTQLALIEGKLADAKRHKLEIVRMAEEDELPAYYLRQAIDMAWIHAWYEGDSARALNVVENALLRFPLDSVAPGDRPYLQLANFHAAGANRTDLARQLLSEYETEIEPAVRNSEPFRFGVAGHLAYVDGKPADALSEFEAWDAETGNPVVALYDMALAHEAAGNADSALAVLERYLSTPYLSRYNQDGWQRARVLKRLGELYEQNGDHDNAIRYYNEFVDLWKDADPELQPQVEDVRERIARLVGEG